mmetsp:Transcript_57447/g.181881  ORF Transcript_57447/g.181881 Transcript_57447/m.181881 type:complete len:464 (+) Transcript_57447:4179-5570(+)
MGCDSCCGMVCCCSRAEAGKIKYVYFFGFLVTACLMWGLRDYPVDAWVNLPGFDLCKELKEAPPLPPDASLPMQGMEVDSGAGGPGGQDTPSGGPPSRKLLMGAPGRSLLQEADTDPQRARQVRLSSSTCVGKNAVLRISFGSFLFFFIMCLVTVGVTTKSSRESLGRDFLHTGIWPVKVVIWLGCLFAPFVFPEDVVHVYAEFARLGGAIFLLVQLFIILEFIYQINERLLDEQSYPGLAKAILVTVTLALYLASLAGIGLMYHYFAPHADCSLNILFITLTLILGLGYTILSVSSIREDTQVRASLFTSGCVMVYTVYLCASAIMSEPVDEERVDHSRCNLQARHTGETGATEVVSFALVLLAVTISTLSAGQDKVALFTSSPVVADGDELPYRPDLFHLIFALASMYMAMLLVRQILMMNPPLQSLSPKSQALNHCFAHSRTRPNTLEQATSIYLAYVSL